MEKLTPEVVYTVMAVIGLVSLVALGYLGVSVYLWLRRAPLYGSGWAWAHGVGTVLAGLPSLVGCWALLVIFLELFAQYSDAEGWLLGAAPAVVATLGAAASGLAWRRWWRERQLSSAP